MQGVRNKARATGTVLLALGAATFGASTAVAQPPFEGVVTMRLNGGAPAGAAAAGARLQEVEYMLRNGKARVSMGGPAGSMSMIMVPAEKKMYMLLAAQNAYMEVPVGDVAAATAAADAAAPKVTKTGRMDKVAGYECETYTLTPTSGTGAGQTTEICIAKGLGAYASPANMLPGAPQPAWQRSLSNAGFPLRVKVPDGSIALEVTKIERKRLSNDLFTVPPTYTKMPTPQVPKR